MNGEILYKYVGNVKKPLDKDDVQKFIDESLAFIEVFEPTERHSKSELGERLCKNATNLEVLGDVYVTSAEILLRLDSTTIKDDLKKKYKKDLADIADTTKKIYQLMLKLR